MKETPMTKRKTSPTPKVVYVTFALIVSKETSVDELVSKVEPMRHHITKAHTSIMGTEMVETRADE